jgi:urease accessory protein UreF
VWGASIAHMSRVDRGDIMASHGGSYAPIVMYRWVYTSRVTYIDRCLHVFLLNHVKGVVSAAVRLGIIGPYQGQKILADRSTRTLLLDTLSEVRDLEVSSAGQTWPLLDIYQGRQEILYSRVFNG